MAGKTAKKTAKRAPEKRTAKKKSSAVMVRKSKTEKPQERIVYVPMQQAGMKVTHDTALTVSALWAGVRAITDPISYLGWHVMERDGEGKKRRNDLWVDWLLNSQANGEMSAGTWRETICAHAITWGNGYAEIERDGSGRPLALWPLWPDRVCPERAPSGELFYVVYPTTGAPIPLPARDVFHLKGLGFDGIQGYSVVQMAARSLGLTMALEQNAASYFANGSRPSGALVYQGKIDAKTKEETAKEWRRWHGGPSKAFNTAIFDQAMKWEGISLSNVDSQMLESRQLQVVEVARWLKVQPHKLMDLENAHYNNVEQQNRDFLQETLMPWINKLEQEADIKLFGPASQGRLFTRMNIKGFLRGDTAAQAEFITAMVDRGIFSINQSLDYLDMDPIGPVGDKRMVPLNMTTLEKLGEEPVVDTPEPAGSPEPDDGESPDASEDDSEDDTGMTNRLNGHGALEL